MCFPVCVDLLLGVIPWTVGIVWQGKSLSVRPPLISPFHSLTRIFFLSYSEVTEVHNEHGTETLGFVQNKLETKVIY